MKKSIFINILVIYGMFANILIAQDKMPDREQRIYALSLIWKELQYNFAFPEKLQQANLDSLYLAYLPQVETVKDNYEYYRVLSSFMAHFNEAHTRIYTSQRPDDTPPIKAVNFGEKIVVSDIAKNKIAEIPIGSEIVRIENIPVADYVRDSVAPYIAAATPQWKFDKSIIELFYGRPQSTINLVIRTPKGKEKNVEMIRNFNSDGAKEVMDDPKPFSPVRIEIIDGNIGYIQLNSFMGGFVDTINKSFDNYLPQLRKCKGLIIDVRGNRGGSDLGWEGIASYLTPGPELNIPVKYFSRTHTAAYKNWGRNSPHPQLKEYYMGTAMEEVTHGFNENKIADSLKLYQPLIVISGQHVASASEDFLLLMKGTGRATIVGEPSVGCVGEPMFEKLPGGNFELMICAKKYVTLDGTQPNDMGILPDIAVKANYDDYLKGKDNVLESAKKELLELVKNERKQN